MPNENSKNIYRLPFNKKIKPFPEPAPWHKENKWLKHALDFAMPEGTPILSASKGKVYSVVDKYSKNYKDKSFAHRCNKIIIEHENREYTNYVHLKKGCKVKEGDSIKKGQCMGYSGSTGYSTYPHLHFAVIRLNSKKVWETIIPKIRVKNKIVLMQSPNK